MNVFSGFDGMSCGRIALERIGIPVTNYYASETNIYATTVSKANYPDIHRLGDITKINGHAFDGVLLPKIDLLIAGSPCQGFSFAGKQLNFDDPRSKLFWEYVRILKELRFHNPNIKFMLENVRMKKEYLDIITDALGVDPIFINSALVSAQNRQRYYWANWEFKTPEDIGIVLSDILEKNLSSCGVGGRIVGRKINEIGKRDDYNKNIPISQYLEIRDDQKANCMTTVYKDSIVPYFKTNKRLIIKFNQSDIDSLVIQPGVCRQYSVKECERLQTVPDNFTNSVSDAQRYRMLSNGWTVDVIAHILEGLK